MDIQTRKIEFIKEFLRLQNEELIIRMEEILRTNKSNKSIDLRPMTISRLNERIDKSMDDSNNDRLTTLSDLITEIEKWG